MIEHMTEDRQLYSFSGKSYVIMIASRRFVQLFSDLMLIALAYRISMIAELYMNFRGRVTSS
jgi:hypothetical protein